MSTSKVNPADLQKFYEEFLKLKINVEELQGCTGKAMYEAGNEFEDLKSDVVQNQRFGENLQLMYDARFGALESENRSLRVNLNEARNTIETLNEKLNIISIQNNSFQSEINMLKQATTELRNATPSVYNQNVPSITTVPIREPRLNDPELFTGNKKKARSFILQCRNIFLSQPMTYNTDSAKVAFIISFLRGPAFEWVSPYLEVADDCLHNIDLFLELFNAAFSDIDRKTEVAKQLTEIKQGTRGAATLVSEFHRLAVESKWPDSVLIQLFYNALNSNLKDEICRFDRPDNIDEFYKLAVRLDNRLTERKNERKGDQERVPYKPAPRKDPNAMIIGTTQFKAKTVEDNSDTDSHNSKRTLSKEERQYRKDNNLCAYCGSDEHALNDCAKRRSTRKAKNFPDRR
jgi:hypothetical protein